MGISEIDVLIRISIAIVCGLLIGLERQITGHQGGIKTNILISLGSCIFVLFSFLIDAEDKTRIAAQVVSGVGFLCSSVIIKNGASINGLNTSATIWCSSGIGVLCSLGMYRISFIVTLVLIASNLFFYPIAARIPILRKFDEDNEETSYKLSVHCENNENSNIGELRKYIIDIINKSNFSLMGFDTKYNDENKNEDAKPIIKLSVTHIGKTNYDMLEEIITQLTNNEHIIGVNWKVQ